MSGNKLSQQWVITRDDRGYPEVYVELDVNTSQPLGSSAYALLTEATRHLGDLAVVIRRTEPGAAPETVEANVVDVVNADSDPAQQRIGDLRDDMRGLVDLAAAWAENSDAAGSKGLLAAAQQLTRKYDL